MNKHLYLCHLLVLSSPTLMMHGHMNLKFTAQVFCYEENENSRQIKLHVVPLTLVTKPMSRQNAPLYRHTVSSVLLA